jgi:hypothetical protein
MILARSGRLYGYESNAFAIEQHLDVVSAGDALDVFVAIALQPNRDVVFGILRERVFHDHATVGTEGLIFELLLLSEIGGQRLQVAAGRLADDAERQPADTLGSLQVTFE